MNDPSAILTIELTCTEGGNDLEVNLASGYYPSLVKCDARACKSVSSDVHTLVIQPSSQLSIKSDLPTTLIVGVHMKDRSSNLKLPFSVWAMDSTSPHNSVEIDRVTNAIAAFNLLSSYPKDELWKNMPKLHRLAQGESLKPKSSTRLLNVDSLGGHTSIAKTPSHDEELRDLEQFISKSGRMKMKSKIERYRNTREISEWQPTNRLDRLMDPNHHSDLFTMTSPEDFREIAASVDSKQDCDLNKSPTSPTKHLKLFELASQGFESPSFPPY